MKGLQAFAEEVFMFAGAPEGAEVSIKLADEEEMRALNREWRGCDYATNVLSFPTGDKELLGDIVLCEPVIRREAREEGKSYEAHLAHMLMHGMLHLLGFDHGDEAEAGRMEKLEIKALGKLGIRNPYE